MHVDLYVWFHCKLSLKKYFSIGLLTCFEVQNFCLESQAEKISYITLLEDWQIFPDHLLVLNKTLGSGKFGIVKQGIYMPFKEGDPEKVAVKMLKGEQFKM